MISFISELASDVGIHDFESIVENYLKNAISKAEKEKASDGNKSSAKGKATDGKSSKKGKGSASDGQGSKGK